ncbi:MAG: hypothetical protein GEV10_21455 [Streptosporangiales bacterium]|nr:hypothetical protein [Streptosporangiales bacterium]
MKAVGYGPGDAMMAVPRRYAGMNVHRERSGDRGSWNTALHTPEPGAVYVVDEQFLYVTDERGRVEHVEGWLGHDEGTVTDAGRVRPAAGAAGSSWRLEIGEGGHLVATKVSGGRPGTDIVAMTRKLDGARSANWRTMESEWAALRRRGEQVHATIDVDYTGRSRRANFFQVSYRHQGREYIREFDR